MVLFIAHRLAFMVKRVPMRVQCTASQDACGLPEMGRLGRDRFFFIHRNHTYDRDFLIDAVRENFRSHWTGVTDLCIGIENSIGFLFFSLFLLQMSWLRDSAGVRQQWSTFLVNHILTDTYFMKLSAYPKPLLSPTW